MEYLPSLVQRWILDSTTAAAYPPLQPTPSSTVSLLGVIATESRQALVLDATQTPPGLSSKATGVDYSRHPADSPLLVLSICTKRSINSGSRVALTLA